MKLLRIEIENFGKLCGFSLKLEEGLNLLCEKNGWGKSTLAVFIKAMLYGLPATRMRDTDRNERKKYTPWQGGAYGGSIEFESEKGRFRAERFFGAKEANDEFRLFDLSNNKPSTAYSANLGVELFGIDAEGFERSTYLSQRAIDPTEGTASVTTKLTGLLDDVNDIGNFEVAMDAIDKRRQFYELKGGRGRVSDLKNDLQTARDELERCRALLPSQHELESRLDQAKDQERSAEEELKELQGTLRRAELRRRDSEEHQRMLNRLREFEQRRKEILRSFRDQMLPTDEELRQNRQLLAEYRKEQAEVNRYCLTEEETVRLKTLASRFPNGIPRADVLDRAQEAIDSLATVQTELKAVGTLPESRELAHFKKLNVAIPSQALLDSATEALDRADALRMQQSEHSQAAERATKRKPWLIPSILLAGGGLLAALGATLPNLTLPLLILGGALVAAGFLWLLLASKETKNTKESRKIDLQAQRDQALGYVRGILEKYRVPIAENGELRAALHRLILLAHTAQRDEKQEKQREAQILALNERLSDARHRVNTFFLSTGASEPPKDANVALNQIRTERAEYASLSAKKASSEKKYEVADKQLREKQAILGAFLARLNISSGSHPEERLLQMERLCKEHAELLGAMTKQRREQEDFAREHRLTEESTFPSEDDLKAREKALERRLEEQRSNAVSLKRQLERTAEQTQGIPELEDNAVRLEEEWKQAKGNLALLKRTAEFLTDSKEALSTRYLAGVQEHFTRYRALLEGEAAPRAVIDTDFNVSVTVGGKSRETEYFSKGSRDVLQFCARLALVRAMFTDGETPFLLLDDPFVNLDEDNLAAAKALLEKLSDELQILYFVCHAGRL